MRTVQRSGLLIALAGMAVLPASADTFDLGAAAGFSVFSGATAQDQTVNFVTNGLVGGFVSTVGFPAGDVATSTQISAANTAFDSAYATESALANAGSSITLSSTPLTPGDYHTTTTTLPSTLIFDGAGDYIILINGSLTDTNTSFVLEGGATAADILFIATGADVENATNPFEGTIFVNGSATVHTPTGGGTITGGIFSMGDLVIQYTNPGLSSTEIINAPNGGVSTPEPASVVLLVTILAVCGYAFKRRHAAAQARV